MHNINLGHLQRVDAKRPRAVRGARCYSGATHPNRGVRRDASHTQIYAGVDCLVHMAVR
jgi:hypothetical protein